jgi:hypothetical protein
MHIYRERERKINETHQILLEKGKGGVREVKNIIEGVNLFKVQGMHIWNFHNETPLYY